jgi:hypothetical protein
MEHTSCMLDKESRMHARSCTRPRVPAPTHARKYVIRIAFPRQLIRERASLLCYTYIICLVFCCHLYFYHNFYEFGINYASYSFDMFEDVSLQLIAAVRLCAGCVIRVV